MNIKWNIDDGYVNRRPDWETSFDAEDFEGLTRDEAEAAIFEIIEEEKAKTVHSTCTNLEDLLDAIAAHNMQLNEEDK